MDWVLEHFRLIIIIGGAIAYWLNQRRKAKEEAEVARTLTQPSPQAQPQLNEEAERVRRIQEEIRRKILERTTGTQPVRPQSRQEPVRTILPPPMPKVEARQDAYTQSEDRPAESDQELLDHQKQLAEKMRELEEARRHIAGKAEVFAEKTAMSMAAGDTAQLGSFLADLRDPIAVRRAIVLREVLGTPVGLR